MSRALPLQEAMRWCQLAPEHLPAMHALHRLSIAGMAAQAVKPESREFLLGLLHGRGRVLGVWFGDGLVAYGVLQHDLLPEDSPRDLLGLAAHEPVYKLAGAAVHPAWRGQGLQRLLTERRMALADGRPVFATAAPCNVASWRNLLACGLAVRAVQYRYGGHARYLLARVPGDGFDAGRGPQRELGPGALALQQELLAQGWRGVRPGVEAGSLCLARGPDSR